MAKEEVKETSSKKDSTKVIGCSCFNQYQDERYGAGRRLHNPGKDGKVHRCTVCGTEKLS